MKAPGLSLLRAALLCLAAASVQAQGIHRLDSTASPRQQVAAMRVLDENGRPLANNPFAQQANAYFGRVEYRVATAAFVGQQARISLVVPPHVRGLRRADGLLFHWKGVDGTLSGQATPGQRQLIWSGRVTEAFTSLAIELGMQVDLSAMGDSAGLVGVEPGFELELLP